MKRKLISILLGLCLLGVGYFASTFVLAIPPMPPKITSSLLLKTGQTTVYAIGDDADKLKGITKAYTVYSTVSQSGTVNVDSPHYAAATIAFAATTPGTITDSASLLATVLTGDTIKVYNSTLNSGVYTVSTGGVAGTIRTTEATVLEAAGAYVTILKRASHSNNTVKDLNTGLEWARYVQTGKIGPNSDGKLNWVDATKCYTLHPAAADLAMVAGNILRITGSNESSRFFAGAVLVNSGFANAVNNLPGLVVSSVSFTGGNTDIMVNSGNQTLIAEAAGGSRNVKIICQSIYSYCAAANVALLGRYGDWRVANRNELSSLIDSEVPTSLPDSTAFPSFPATILWVSSIRTVNVTSGSYIRLNNGDIIGDTKTENYLCLLVRGG